MDYLSRHPLPITGTDNTEKDVKSVLTTEHAVVIDRIRKETAGDKQLQKLYKRIIKEDWQKHRKNDDIKQFLASGMSSMS